MYERLFYNLCRMYIVIFFFIELIIKEYCVKIFFVFEIYLVNLVVDLWFYRKILVDML